MRNLSQLPEGVQDYLPGECAHKKRVELAISEQFALWGYEWVETPTFEYAEVFTGGVGATGQEKLMQFIDPTGAVMALRPDLTMPIARMAALSLGERAAVGRYCYIGQAYGRDNSRSGMQREFTQAGIELMGMPSPQGDAEVIALAIACMQAAGLGRVLVDIGQVEYFKGLMDQARLSAEQAEGLRRAVESKNLLGMELILKRTDLSGSLRDHLMQLPMLYGGEEVLSEAAKVTDHPRAVAALENIRQVYDLLVGYGLRDSIAIDLGMVRSLDYYSGVIFRGVTDLLGQELFSGGRYDRLCERFGRHLPATGFACGIGRVLAALSNQGQLAAQPRRPGVLVGYDPQDSAAAYALLSRLRARGVIAVSCPGREAFERQAGEYEQAQWMGGSEDA
ncbi:MAG: ATP phosphoribosyltransferase regulatory subunit [Christensenellales bacterium]|jgi:ATP phosphoribosyltransferase regulatory subunit